MPRDMATDNWDFQYIYYKTRYKTTIKQNLTGNCLKSETATDLDKIPHSDQPRCTAKTVVQVGGGGGGGEESLAQKKKKR